MTDDRIHVVRVRSERNIEKVQRIVTAMDRDIGKKSIQSAYDELPNGPGLQAQPVIPSNHADRIKLEEHQGHVIVEGLWAVGDEDLVLAALEKLAALKVKEAFVNGSGWQSAAQLATALRKAWSRQ